MYSRKFGVHGLISAAVAFAILGIAVLVLDRGFLFAAPAGVVEVDQPAPVEQLGEVSVVAQK
jgi:hypothetical protein